MRNASVGLAKDMVAAVPRSVPASPPARSLATELRQLSTALQESPDADLSTTSLASCSNSQLHRSADAQSGRRRNLALTGPALRDLWSSIAQLKGQSESSRRRLAQVEQRLEAQLQDRLESKGDVRERLAEIQGTADALVEDMQSLRSRMDVLDQRRVADASKDFEKRAAELATQLQALEHQSRVNTATFEENQRRQVTRQRRCEQGLEELSSRLTAWEETSKTGVRALARENDADVRIRKLEQRQEYSDTALRRLQGQVEDVLSAQSLVAEAAPGFFVEHDVEEVRVPDRGLMALEAKTSAQMQDLSSKVAALRVKLDGQLQRTAGLAERFEVNEPLAVLRADWSAVRSQDQQRWESEMAGCQGHLQELSERLETSLRDVNEAFRKNTAELLAARPVHDRDRKSVV